MTVDEIKTKQQKYWSELSESEKIERMREQIKNLQQSIRGLENSIRNLSEHNHLNNEIVMPIRSRHGYGEGEQMRKGPGKDDIYF